MSKSIDWPTQARAMLRDIPRNYPLGQARQMIERGLISTGLPKASACYLASLVAKDRPDLRDDDHAIDPAREPKS